MKQCRNCGSQISDSAVFCRVCGEKQTEDAVYNAAVPSVRNVFIYRKSRFTASATKVKVYVDGETKNSVGSLPSGGSVQLQLDSNEHLIDIHGGAMSSKDFAAKIHVPSGGYSYNYQLDIMEYKRSNNYTLVPRPMGQSPLDEDLRGILLIGSAVCEILAGEKLRAMLRQNPAFELELLLLDNSWALCLLNNGSRAKIVQQPYASRSGGLMAAIEQNVERAPFKDAEARDGTLEHLFNSYICLLPDYYRTGKNTFKIR